MLFERFPLTVADESVAKALGPKDCAGGETVSHVLPSEVYFFYLAVWDRIGQLHCQSPVILA